MVAFELIKYFTQLSQPFLSFLFSLRMRKEMKRKELRCLLPKGTVQLIQFLLKKLIGCCSCGELNGFGFCFFLCWGVMAAAAAMLRNKRENKTKNQIQIQQKEEKWVKFFNGMKATNEINEMNVMNGINWVGQRNGIDERNVKPSSSGCAASPTTLLFFCRPAQAPSKRRKDCCWWGAPSINQTTPFLLLEEKKLRVVDWLTPPGLTALIHLLFWFHSTPWNQIKKMKWLAHPPLLHCSFIVFIPIKQFILNTQRAPNARSKSNQNQSSH